MPNQRPYALERTPLFEQVARGLEELILSGELRIGDKLPSVEALAARYSVSRSVIREALIRLRTDGLTETFNGSGTFVKPIDSNHLANALARQLPLLEPDAQAVRNLFEARVGIERTTARLAAQRASPKDVRDLKAALRSMKLSTTRTNDWIQADLGFHITIATAARNPFLQTLIAPMTQVIGTSILTRLEGEEHDEAMRSGIASHGQLLEAITQHDGARAERLMCDHLMHAQERLLKTLDGPDTDRGPASRTAL